MSINSRGYSKPSYADIYNHNRELLKENMELFRYVCQLKDQLHFAGIVPEKPKRSHAEYDTEMHLDDLKTRNAGLYRPYDKQLDMSK